MSKWLAGTKEITLVVLVLSFLLLGWAMIAPESAQAADGTVAKIVKLRVTDGKVVAVLEDGNVLSWGNHALPSNIVRVNIADVLIGGNRERNYLADGMLFLKKDGTVSSYNVPLQTKSNVAKLTSVAKLTKVDGYVYAIRTDGTFVRLSENPCSNYVTTSFPLCTYTSEQIAAGLKEKFTNILDITEDLILKRDGTLVTYETAYASTLISYVVPVEARTSIKSIATNSTVYGNEYFAVKTNGTVVGWKSFIDWNNGNKPMTELLNIPIALNDVKSFTASYNLYSALKNDGSLIAWGGIYDEFLGDYFPMAAPQTISNVALVEADTHNIYALKTDGTIENVGTDKSNLAKTPRKVIGANRIVANERFWYAVSDTGTVLSWSQVAPLPKLKSIAASVKSISCIYKTCVVLKNDGTVWGIGANNNIIDDGIDYLYFHQDWFELKSLGKVKLMKSNGSTLLFLKEDGTVAVRGMMGDVENYTVPSGLTNVIDVAINDINAFALKLDGTVVRWGDQSQPAINVIGASKIFASQKDFMAIRADGSLAASTRQWSKTDLTRLSNIADVTFNGNNLFLLKKDGTVTTVGYIDNSIRPSTTLKNVKQIHPLTADSMIALLTDGTVKVWGLDRNQVQPAHTYNWSAILADKTPPSTPVGLTAEIIDDSSFILNWAPSTDSLDIAYYEVFLNGSKNYVSNYFGNTSGNSAFVAIYGTGLNPSMSVRAVDMAGNVSAISTPLIVNLPDVYAPQAPQNLSLSNITGTSARLSWTVPYDNVGVKGYNVYIDGKYITSTTSTAWNFTGLSPNTTYKFSVLAYDAATNKSLQSLISGTTLRDTTPPSVPTGLSSSNLTTNSFVLSWLPATDNVAVMAYDVYRSGTYVGTTSGTNYTITGLFPGVPYFMTVVAIDSSGNRSFSSNQLSVTLAATDVYAPTVPTNLAVNGTTGNSISLVWSASTDNVGVKGYNVYVNGAFRTSTSLTNITISGLNPATTYTFYIIAYDAAGNRSAASTVVSGTTGAEAIAPTALTGLTQVSATSTTVSVKWNPSTDNAGMGGYLIYRNNVYVGTTTLTSYTFSGLVANTSYSIMVIPFDTSKNRGASATITVKTTL